MNYISPHPIFLDKNVGRPFKLIGDFAYTFHCAVAAVSDDSNRISADAHVIVIMLHRVLLPLPGPDFRTS
jgi:hypothetical protein